MWIEPAGFYLKQNSMDSMQGFSSTAEGVLFGVDAMAYNDVLLGIGAGYMHSYTKWDESQGVASISEGLFGFYTNYYFDSFFVEGSLLTSMGSYDTQRRIFIQSQNPNSNYISAVAKGDHWSYSLDTHFGVGGTFYVMRSEHQIQMQPFALFDYTLFFQRGFEETGAGALDLTVERRFSQMLRSEVGLSFSSSFSIVDGGCLTPKIWLSAVSELFIPSKDFKSGLRNQSFDFYTPSFYSPIYLASPGIELHFMFKGGKSFDIRYFAELNESITTQKLDARIDWNY
jgi:uncharacterized protein with beta-barrel porin domain